MCLCGVITPKILSYKDRLGSFYTVWNGLLLMLSTGFAVFFNYYVSYLIDSPHESLIAILASNIQFIVVTIQYLFSYSNVCLLRLRFSLVCPEYISFDYGSCFTFAISISWKLIIIFGVITLIDTFINAAIQNVLYVLYDLPIAFINLFVFGCYTFQVAEERLNYLIIATSNRHVS